MGSIPFIGKLFGYEGTNANNNSCLSYWAEEIDERMMNNAGRAAVDARAMLTANGKNKNQLDELLRNG